MNSVSQRPVILVIGASSAIAQAVIEQTLAAESYDVFALSRQTILDRDRLQSWQTDYSEDSLSSVFAGIAQQQRIIGRVIIANGVLHNERLFPEKQLRECSSEAMSEVFHVNCVIPMLCLQQVLTLLSKQSECEIALFSARVGSLGDNKLGGWYSYRASKAALNMMLVTTFRELKRTHPNVKLLAFHPGTTESPLSQPFLQRVAVEKRFTPSFVAANLMTIMDELVPSEQMPFLDWNNQSIPW